MSPIEWRWPTLRVSGDRADYWSQMGFGALLCCDEGYVSTDSKAGQVWHWGMMLVIRFFWWTCRIIVTSPIGKLMPYEYDALLEEEVELGEIATRVAPYLRKTGEEQFTVFSTGSWNIE